LANLQANAGEFSPGALDALTKNFPTANDPTARGQINITTPGGTAIAVPLQQFTGRWQSLPLWERLLALVAQTRH